MVAPISASAAGMSPASRVCMNGSDIETSSKRAVGMAGTSIMAPIMDQRPAPASFQRRRSRAWRPRAWFGVEGVERPPAVGDLAGPDDHRPRLGRPALVLGVHRRDDDAHGAHRYGRLRNAAVGQVAG